MTVGYYRRKKKKAISKAQRIGGIYRKNSEGRGYTVYGPDEPRISGPRQRHWLDDL